MNEIKPTGKIITRFAPSPTGYLHMGGARTALFNHLFTKQRGGKAILRIEDTDKERSTKEYETSIIESLKWLGLDFDETCKQSDREEIYKKYLKKLIDDGKAYVSKETADGQTPPRPLGDSGVSLDPSTLRSQGIGRHRLSPAATADGRRSEVIRFKNPNVKIRFTDLIRGEVEFDTTELKDFVIAKSLEEPLYHLAVVVDDFEMGVTHVIRGEDHISNTPRQILIQEAIGAPRPIYAHLPIILATDKSKLSKRKHGESASLDFYRKKGYLPEAIINFLALLGWNPGTDQELFDIKQLESAFDLGKVQKSGAVFNVEKLDWLNRQYLLKLSDEEFLGQAAAFLPEWLSGKDQPIKSQLLNRLLPLIKDKISAFGEIKALFKENGELRFVKELTDYKAESLLWKKNPDKAATIAHLQECRLLIESMAPEPFTAESIKTTIWPYAEAKGKGEVLWPLRVALTGQEKSPDPFVSASVLGREESLRRIDVALKK